MKSKSLCLALITLFLSCSSLEGIDESENGIYLQFDNYTESEYNGYKFYIGAIKNNEFIATDSIVSDKLINSLLTAEPITDGNGDKYVSISGFYPRSELSNNGWRPDYEEIRSLSNTYTFKIVFPNGREKVFFEAPHDFEDFAIGTERIIIKDDSLSLYY